MNAARADRGAGPATEDAQDSELARWLTHLESLHPRGQAGIELGLERVRRVSEALAQAIACPVIIVGGTNGKGSTCAYLEAAYTLAGYAVGTYTSPHLLVYGERVRFRRQVVDAATLCTAFARVEEARLATGALSLTYFEFGTLAAVEVFRALPVDLMILEVGLGGRLDAVNAYEPSCSIVTSVTLDHTEWLGPTRTHIGYEKAGIFRAEKPAICADPDPPASLLAHAQAIGADLFLLGRDFGYLAESAQWTFWGRHGLRRAGLPLPALRGRGQLRNASAALMAIELLRPQLPLPMQAVRGGLVDVHLPGRFQVLSGRPVVVLDVAHNAEAAAALADGLAEMGFCRRTFAVVGMLADKEHRACLQPFAGKVAGWLLADLDTARGALATSLAAVVQQEQLGGNVACCVSPAAAFARAAEEADEDDRIVVFGSFYTVAAVMQSLGDGRHRSSAASRFR